MMKRLLLLIALGASGCISVRAPTAPAERVETASGSRVTLPHWFRADFLGAVEDAQEIMQTPNGAMPCRRFTSKSATSFSEVRVIESPNGFDASWEAMLAEMANKAREGKTVASTNVVHQGNFDGVDMKLIAPPHSPDNASDFTIACRSRVFLSGTKIVLSNHCGDATHPDPALEASADSLAVLD